MKKQEQIIPSAITTSRAWQRFTKPPDDADDFPVCGLKPFCTVVWQLGDVSRLLERGGPLQSSFARTRFPASRTVAYAMISNGHEHRVNQRPVILWPGSFNLRNEVGQRGANCIAIGRTMCDVSRHGVASTVVFAEYLAQQAPDGRDRVEHSVPILDAMFVENVLGKSFVNPTIERVG
jgi:hypothetical protein